MRLHRLLGGRKLSWIRRRCHRQLCRPKFPCADHRGVGGITPPLGLLILRHAAQTRGEAGVKQRIEWCGPDRGAGGLFDRGHWRNPGVS